MFYVFVNYKLVLVIYLSLLAQAGKESTYNAGDLGFNPWENPLEKGKATHSSILAWRHNWATFTHSLSTATRTKSCAAEAAGFQHLLKGVQGREQKWGTRAQEVGGDLEEQVFR